MRSTRQRRLAWLSLILAVSLTAAACGDDDDDAGTADDGGSGSASGEVNISGSSTVLPITQAVGEAFQEENADATVNVDGPGTGDGFELFCNGETDISDASRQIEDEEAAACEENGVEYVELQIGYDGITVMTSPNNDAVECLSFADLYALVGPESEGVDTWAAAQDLATQLGSQTELPDEDLTLVGPGPESGTYDSFIELALADIAESQGVPEDQAESTRPDYQQSADDNQIISGVEGADYSLGWVGFAYAEEAGDQVKELAVSAEPGGDCVEPSPDTIADGSYPLARSLYIYVSKAAATDNPAVVPFVDFYLDGLSDFVEGAGYVALPDDQAQATTAAWEEGRG
ncbi:MAG TPA: substrate-binding domain-containing protein [Acidimicrobiales bacterium]